MYVRRGWYQDPLRTCPIALCQQPRLTDMLKHGGCQEYSAGLNMGRNTVIVSEALFGGRDVHLGLGVRS